MLRIGMIVNGKYEVLEKIAETGMFSDYLVKDINLNKLWALKEGKNNYRGEFYNINRNILLTDVNIMKKLDHPSFPRIVDIIDNGTSTYVVMDYIQGESLDKILARDGFQSEKNVINWAKQICEALDYLHKQNPPIVYRDMKPDNVMLNSEGNIKIINCGIAIEDRGEKQVIALGTKGYAPPEQCEGKVDIRSDIFALGMTMHYLLTDVNPADPRSRESYKPVRQWNPELSEKIEKIIDRCVEENVEDRYQNCAELLYDLDGPEIYPSPDGIGKRRWLRRFIIVAVIFFLFLFVLAVLETES